MLSKKVDLFKNGQEAGNYVNVAVGKLVSDITDGGTKLNDSYEVEDLLNFCAALFYLILDRQAFELLGATKRDQFSDGILDSIVTLLSEQWNDPKGVMPIIGKGLNKNIDVLAPYASMLYPKKNENPKGTLFWEFMKLLNSEFGIDTADAVSGQFLAIQLSNDLIKSTERLLPRKEN